MGQSAVAGCSPQCEFLCPPSSKSSSAGVEPEVLIRKDGRDEHEHALAKAHASPSRSLKETEAIEEDLRLKVKSCEVQVHSAQLVRSFAKIGHMHIYAIVSGGEKEVLRTAASRGNKTPSWEEKVVLSEVPEMLDIALWDKNEFHRDVLCGRVSIPCSADMLFDEQDFLVEKKGQPTGNVCISIKVEFDMAETPAPPARSVGAEFDNVITACADNSNQRKSKRTKTVLALSNLIIDDEADGEEQDEEKKPPALDRVTSSPSHGFKAHAMVGTWECVGTHGLEEFMIKSGVGTFQRKIAKAAKWPMWEFAANGELLLFNNHSAIGILKEEIKIGPEYKWTDGKGNDWKCVAKWMQTKSGGELHIARQGSLGSYEERRVVDGSKLEFTLSNPQYEASWGRSFVRKS
mmetsp:Transcript_51965/g.121679  ORF Transcript_51965/g.121679 Transcript_51965/m.121679 type:complete len:404 (-) Transcript_51965:81-1292(-)